MSETLNHIGLRLQDYKWKDSTLCAGCGHEIMSPRVKIEKNIKKVTREGTDE